MTDDVALSSSVLFDAAMNVGSVSHLSNWVFAPLATELQDAAVNSHSHGSSPGSDHPAPGVGPPQSHRWGPYDAFVKQEIKSRVQLLRSWAFADELPTDESSVPSTFAQSVEQDVVHQAGDEDPPALTATPNAAGLIWKLGALYSCNFLWLASFVHDVERDVVRPHHEMIQALTTFAVTSGVAVVQPERKDRQDIVASQAVQWHEIARFAEASRQAADAVVGCLHDESTARDRLVVDADQLMSLTMDARSKLTAWERTAGLTLTLDAMPHKWTSVIGPSFAAHLGDAFQDAAQHDVLTPFVVLLSGLQVEARTAIKQLLLVAAETRKRCDIAAEEEAAKDRIGSDRTRLWGGIAKRLAGYRLLAPREMGQRKKLEEAESMRFLDLAIGLRRALDHGIKLDQLHRRYDERKWRTLVLPMLAHVEGSRRARLTELADATIQAWRRVHPSWIAVQRCRELFRWHCDYRHAAATFAVVSIVPPPSETTSANEMQRTEAVATPGTAEVKTTATRSSNKNRVVRQSTRLLAQGPVSPTTANGRTLTTGGGGADPSLQGGNPPPPKERSSSSFILRANPIVPFASGGGDGGPPSSPRPFRCGMHFQTLQECFVRLWMDENKVSVSNDGGDDAGGGGDAGAAVAMRREEPQGSSRAITRNGHVGEMSMRQTNSNARLGSSDRRTSKGSLPSPSDPTRVLMPRISWRDLALPSRRRTRRSASGSDGNGSCATWPDELPLPADASKSLQMIVRDYVVSQQQHRLRCVSRPRHHRRPLALPLDGSAAATPTSPPPPTGGAPAAGGTDRATLLTWRRMCARRRQRRNLTLHHARFVASRVVVALAILQRVGRAMLTRDWFMRAHVADVRRMGAAVMLQSWARRVRHLSAARRRIASLRIARHCQQQKSLSLERFLLKDTAAVALQRFARCRVAWRDVETKRRLHRTRATHVVQRAARSWLARQRASKRRAGAAIVRSRKAAAERVAFAATVIQRQWKRLVARKRYRTVLRSGWLQQAIVHDAVELKCWAQRQLSRLWRGCRIRRVVVAEARECRRNDKRGGEAKERVRYAASVVTSWARGTLTRQRLRSARLSQLERQIASLKEQADGLRGPLRKTHVDGNAAQGAVVPTVASSGPQPSLGPRGAERPLLCMPDLSHPPACNVSDWPAVVQAQVHDSRQTPPLSTSGIAETFPQRRFDPTQNDAWLDSIANIVAGLRVGSRTTRGVQKAATMRHISAAGALDTPPPKEQLPSSGKTSRPQSAASRRSVAAPPSVLSSHSEANSASTTRGARSSIQQARRLYGGTQATPFDHAPSRAQQCKSSRRHRHALIVAAAAASSNAMTRGSPVRREDDTVAQFDSRPNGHLPSNAAAARGALSARGTGHSNMALSATRMRLFQDVVHQRFRDLVGGTDGGHHPAPSRSGVLLEEAGSHIHGTSLWWPSIERPTRDIHDGLPATNPRAPTVEPFQSRGSSVIVPAADVTRELGPVGSKSRRMLLGY